MSHLIVIADTLQDILDHELVIDVTFYRTENVYHGKAYTVGGVTVESESHALNVMLLELHKKIDDLFNAERN